jgi:hypothetical protein
MVHRQIEVVRDHLPNGPRPFLKWSGDGIEMAGDHLASRADTTNLWFCNHFYIDREQMPNGPFSRGSGPSHQKKWSWTTSEWSRTISKIVVDHFGNDPGPLLLEDRPFGNWSSTFAIPSRTSSIRWPTI